MTRRLFSSILAGLCSGVTSRGQEKDKGKPGAATVAALEPLVASISPVIMRTETSRIFSESHRTVITPARETETGISELSLEEFAALKISWEEFLKRATAAAGRLFASITPDIHRDSKKVADYATLKSKRHFTPMVMLCPEFRKKFVPLFGEKLVVLMPDQFTLYVFPRSFSGFQKMGERVVTESEASIYPASIEAFEVSAEGVRCIGSFDDGTGSGSGVK